MNRKQFFIALFTAPFAAFAATKAKPVASEMVVKITCDTSEMAAALEALSAKLTLIEQRMAPVHIDLSSVRIIRSPGLQQ